MHPSSRPAPDSDDQLRHLCPSLYRKLIPAEASHLIELSDEANGPARMFYKTYFYFGEVPSGGIGLTYQRGRPDRCFFAFFTKEETRVFKEELRRTSFSVGNAYGGCDGSSGILKVRSPDYYAVELEWSVAPEDSWTPLFDLIDRIKEAIIAHPEMEEYGPYVAPPPPDSEL